MKPQNILIVMADQLTALALGCYGHPVVKSPHIDRLAGEGVIFDAAYSSSPLCTPARYAFMTGQHVSRCGGYDNAAYMPATMPTFAHYMRLMGYRTGLSGKMHFVGPDQLHGFEERYTTDVYPADFGWIPDWTRPDERIDLWYHNMSSVKQAGVASISNQLAYDDEVGAQALRAIYDHARSTDDRPMCLVASFIHPHDPYATRQQHWDLYEDESIELPTVARPDASAQDPHSLRLEKAIALDAVDIDDDDIRRARRAYYGNVSYVDDWVGRLRAALEETGLAENTTIVFTSDHGDMLGEFGLWYKMSFREWSCRIPLIVWQPGAIQPRRVAQPVSHVDVLPTLTALASDATGRPVPEAIDPLAGRSLLPLCHGDDGLDPDMTVSEYLAEGNRGADAHDPQRQAQVHELSDGSGVTVRSRKRSERAHESRTERAARRDPIRHARPRRGALGCGSDGTESHRGPAAPPRSTCSATRRALPELGLRATTRSGERVHAQPHGAVGLRLHVPLSAPAGVQAALAVSVWHLLRCRFG